MEKLTESGEIKQIMRSHAAFFRGLLSAHAQGVRHPAIEDMARRCREIDNVRAALDWSFSPEGDLTTGVVLAAAYAPIWLHLSLLVECRERVQQALDAVSRATAVSADLIVQLQIALGVTLFETTASASRSESIFADALRVAQELRDINSHLRALWGMCMYWINDGNVHAAMPLTEQFLRAARQKGDLPDILVAERIKGGTMHYLGHQSEARYHLARVVDLYVAPSDQRHTRWFLYDQRMLARTMHARILWLQGFLDQAKRAAVSIVEDATATDHVPSLCYALGAGVCPIALRIGDNNLAEQSIATLKALAFKHSLTFWTKLGPCLEGALYVGRREPGLGLPLLSAALDVSRKTGLAIHLLGFIGDLAEGLGQVGRWSEGAAMIDEAFDRYDHAGVRCYFPEMLRLKGELLLKDPTAGQVQQAERCLIESINLAHQQDALFWELRAATSLARLRVVQHRHNEARLVLRPVFDRFSEGFETADLCSAAFMLESLTTE